MSPQSSRQSESALPFDDALECRGHSQSLVVLLHGYAHTPSSLDGVRKAIANADENADLFVPHLRTNIWSFRDPNVIVQELLDRLDRVWARRREREGGQGYDRIVFVGHCIGALLARKLYLCARGETSLAPFEDPIHAAKPRDWAPAVKRLILLAGMNRGWTISHHLSFKKAIVWSVGTIAGSVLSWILRKKPLIFHVRRGAPFITQLRIQWLAMKRLATAQQPESVLVVQLLGSIDDVVSPKDNIDLITGSGFVYLDIPHSGHNNVIEMDDTSPGRKRKAIFLQALNEGDTALGDRSVNPGDLEPRGPNLAVTDVVFVIHGIRDEGFWTNKIARHISALARENGRECATETSSYGYFAMLPFLFRWKRRARVEWLMDQYTEDLALYPNADFSFVGHSNGTYMLAKALQEYPACHFRNVVFAGSVVKTTFDWQRLVKEGRVQAVLNFVATTDCVVAVFPKLFELLHLQDLGSAGHDGFAVVPGYEVRYAVGWHDAALKEDFWDAIARFVVHSDPGNMPPGLIRNRRSRFSTLLGWSSPLLWLVGISVVLAGAFYIGLCLPTQSESLKTLVLVLYAGVVWFVLTRF